MEGEGDGDFPVYGNLIIEIQEKDDSDYITINDYDLMYEKNISVYDYFCGFTFSLIKLDGSLLSIKCPNPQEHGLIYQIKNNGLPYSYESMNRGDLYIQIKIIQNGKENLETIKNLFPSMGENIENPDLIIENLPETILMVQ